MEAEFLTLAPDAIPSKLIVPEIDKCSKKYAKFKLKTKGAARPRVTNNSNTDFMQTIRYSDPLAEEANFAGPNFK